ncbi:MAG: hypothetical protein V7739_21805 [Motiliproteus sp.]
MALLELILLVFVLLVALSIVWTTLQTGISPMMSSGKACQAMLASINRPANGPLIDLGSGWGTLVIALAREHPRKQVIGYELSWFPWLVSIIRKYSLRLDNLTIYRKDFKNAELSNASILFCYLFPGGMVALHKKLKCELFNEVLIVSNTFALPSCQPTKVIRLNDVYQTPIYVYYWQPKCSFTPRENNDDKPYSKTRKNT